MTSSDSEQRLPPDIIQGSLGSPGQPRPNTPPTFSFMPIGPAPATPSYIPPVRPVVNNAGHFKIKSFQNCNTQYSNQTQNPDFLKNITTTRRILAKRKTGLETNVDMNVDRGFEPQRKVHLNEELVAQTMSNLYISHPRPKVARRNLSSDVAEAMNLNSLEDLEDKFSHQAAITNSSSCEDYVLPPQRTRKVPSRVKVPQLRLSIHQELKSLRSTNNILPESIMARYRPSPRTGSTAVVLWKPPTGSIPDVISSAVLRSGPGRMRCYSEVTSTPYSSHENLCCESDMPSSPLSPPHSCLAGSPTSAEAPELYSPEIEVPPGVNLHRRNSAPEISEPLPFVDDGSMEL